LSQAKKKRSGTSKNITGNFDVAPAGSKRLEGKTVIITGAGSGIGAAAARAFARQGANLVLNDFERARAEETAAAAERVGVRTIVVAGDASSTLVARRLAEAGVKRFEAIHILLNNAGVAGSSLGDGPVTSSQPGSWNAVLKVNLGSVFLCSRFVIPAIIDAGGGAVVNVSSVLALTGSSDFFQSHAYTASKGAIVSLTRAMAACYVDAGVRVNAICPGLIATGMTQGAQSRSGLMAYIAAKQRLVKGMGSPEAVADAALFLASEEARLITGVILPVDGGWSSGY